MRLAHIYVISKRSISLVCQALQVLVENQKAVSANFLCKGKRPRLHRRSRYWENTCEKDRPTKVPRV